MGVSRSAVRAARRRIVSAAAGEALRLDQAQRVGHAVRPFIGRRLGGRRRPRIRKRPDSSLPGRKVVDLPRCHPRSAVCRTHDRQTVRGPVLARPIDRRCPVSLALCAGAYWSSAASPSACASVFTTPRSVRGLLGPFAAAAIPARTSRRVPGMALDGYSSRSMPVFVMWRGVWGDCPGASNGRRTPGTGGAGEIRTHESLRPGGFQDRCHQPLGHRSAARIAARPRPKVVSDRPVAGPVTRSSSRGEAPVAPASEAVVRDPHLGRQDMSAAILVRLVVRRLVHRSVLAAVIAALLVPAIAATPVSAATFQLRLEAGPQAAVRYDAAWRVTASKTLTLRAPVDATGSARASVAGRGTWLKAASGPLSGWWVRESRVAYRPGIIAVTTYSPERTTPLAAARWELYRFDTAGTDDGREGPQGVHRNPRARRPDGRDQRPAVHPDHGRAPARAGGSRAPSPHPRGSPAPRALPEGHGRQDRPLGDRCDERDRPHLRHGWAGDAGNGHHPVAGAGAGLRDHLPGRGDGDDADRPRGPGRGQGPSRAVRAGQPHRPPLQPSRRRGGMQRARRSGLRRRS